MDGFVVLQGAVLETASGRPKAYLKMGDIVYYDRDQGECRKCDWVKKKSRENIAKSRKRSGGGDDSSPEKKQKPDPTGKGEAGSKGTVYDPLEHVRSR